MVRPLRLDAGRGDKTVQGYAVNILDLFFALRPENRPVVLDSEYHPRMRETCECEAKGLPEGWLCGKPECPRTKQAEDSLRNICLATAIPKESGVFSLPDNRSKLPDNWKIGDPFLG
jgi:hypothetical protein